MAPHRKGVRSTSDAAPNERPRASPASVPPLTYASVEVRIATTASQADERPTHVAAHAMASQGKNSQVSAPLMSTARLRAAS